ncbi:hypothetical protein [Sediminicola sp. 1XM1-17]|uniref:hypothetical protein n=1 Tax=Sediminicola sp. 1XM1-17 TaxID=3127702 RepID=UPI003078653A
MRKLFLVTALTIGSLSAFAQNSTTANAGVTAEISIQDGYTEIESSALPEAVATAIATDYPTATVSKAFVNKDKQYKLEVALSDGTSDTLYADENGNWLEM